MGLIGTTMPQGKTTAGKLGGAPGSKPAAAPAQQRKAAPPQRQAQEASDFDSATPRGSRSTLLPIDDFTSGTYVVKVNRLDLIFRNESKNKASPCESTIVEMEVVESNVAKCPSGFQASAAFTDRYYVNLYHSEVKGLLCGLLGKEPHEVNKDLWWACCGRRPDGLTDAEWQETEAEVREAVIGKLVRVSVKFKLREGKHPITEYVWTPYEEAA